MEAINSSEMSVNFHRTTRRCTAEDRSLASVKLVSIVSSVHSVLGDGATHRTLSPEKTPLQNGIHGQSDLRKVLRKRWISHTQPIWLWGYDLLNVSPFGPLIYGARWLSRRPCKMLRFIRSEGLLKGWNREGYTIGHWKSRRKGRSRPTPYAFIHSINHSFIHPTHVFVIGCMRFRLTALLLSSGDWLSLYLLTDLYGSRVRSVGVATKLRAGRQGFDSSQGKVFFSSP
jgi:hypothetical protein